MPYFFTGRSLRKPRNVVCMRTVELLLNDELDGVVRNVWRRLAAAGLPSLADQAHPTNRPHLTLAAAADLPELGPALAGLPLSVTLRGLVLFEGRAAMLAWRVTADAALRELQARIWDLLAGVQRSQLHQPDRWVPHVSLAPRPSPTIATRVLADLAPATGWFVGARSYDSATRTVTTLVTAR
jgi:2'-5' RNA ligase